MVTNIKGSYWHTYMHTHIHTCTNSKITEFCQVKLHEITLNYVNNVGMTEFIEFNVKQIGQSTCSPPQSPGPSSHAEWSSWSTP